MTRRFLALLVFVLPLAAAETAPQPPAIQVDVYSDFQCPYCKGFAEPVHQLERKGVDGVRVSVAFKHFPLDFHPDAPLAHQAAYAAGKQLVAESLSICIDTRMGNFLDIYSRR